MTKFYDGSKLLSIKMTDTRTGIDFENDFFEVGGLEYNADLGAYKVEDVEYLADYAKSYADGTTATSTTPSMRTAMSWSPTAPSHYDIEVM